MRKVVMAYPYLPPQAIGEVDAVLKSRWIGQGPKVTEFEQEFEKKFGVENAVAVNSGTSALELAYALIGIGPGDEVITTALTCTATNLPLVRRGAKLIFADIDPDTLCADPADIRRKITINTKAIVVVDLNGLKADRGPFCFNLDGNIVNIPLVVDAAQALGNFGGDFTICSFQAIKHITTGDGGMLVCRNKSDAEKAKLWRWFGIDRELKLKNNWQPYKQREILFDIEHPGYKFQMNDIAAALGLSGLKVYNWVIQHRKLIFEIYKDAGLPMVDGPNNKYGFACLMVKDRDAFAEHMEKAGVETNVMQVRNDVYQVFAPYRTELPMLDLIDPLYICLPLHNIMTLMDARHVAAAASSFLYER